MPKAEGLRYGVGAGEDAMPDEGDMAIQEKHVPANPVVILPLEHDNDLRRDLGPLSVIAGIIAVQLFYTFFQAGQGLIGEANILR